MGSVTVSLVGTVPVNRFTVTFGGSLVGTDLPLMSTNGGIGGTTSTVLPLLNGVTDSLTFDAPIVQGTSTTGGPLVMGLTKVGAGVVALNANSAGAASGYAGLTLVASGELRVVESGLKSDERVVVSGILDAVPGQKVDPQLAMAKAPAAEPTTNSAGAN